MNHYPCRSILFLFAGIFICSIGISQQIRQNSPGSPDKISELENQMGVHKDDEVFMTMAETMRHVYQKNAAPVILYNQSESLSPFGIISTMTGDPLFDSNSADDFTVPPFKVWKISEIFVNGFISFGTFFDPLSFTVAIYEDIGNAPGDLIYSFSSTNFLFLFGDALINISDVELSSGKYWLSVVAQNSTGSVNTFRWNWSQTNFPVFDSGHFQNPGGGFGLGSDWIAVEDFAPPPTDFSFALVGAESIQVVPTIGEWSLMLLALFLLIFGVTMMKQTDRKYMDMHY